MTDTPIYDRLAGTGKATFTTEATAHTPVRRTVTLGDTTGIATVTYPTGRGTPGGRDLASRAIEVCAMCELMREAQSSVPCPYRCTPIWPE